MEININKNKDIDIEPGDIIVFKTGNIGIICVRHDNNNNTNYYNVLLITKSGSALLWEEERLYIEDLLNNADISRIIKSKNIIISEKE